MPRRAAADASAPLVRAAAQAVPLTPQVRDHEAVICLQEVSMTWAGVHAFVRSTQP